MVFWISLKVSNIGIIEENDYFKHTVCIYSGRYILQHYNKHHDTETSIGECKVHQKISKFAESVAESLLGSGDGVMLSFSLRVFILIPFSVRATGRRM